MRLLSAGLWAGPVQMCAGRAVTSDRVDSLQRSGVPRRRTCGLGSTSGPRGFTLVELLIVMGVIGLLATMLVPLAELNVQRERERELKIALWQIRDAIDEYHRFARTNSGGVNATPTGSNYPASLAVLATGVTDPRIPGRVVYFLRRIPRDPFADPGLPPEKTWVLRSYLSSAENPQPGADVFDVRSASTRVGLNGVPLKDW